MALYLAAAGIGRMIILHGGDLAAPDLNRQVLMSADWIGRPRADKIRETLLRFNPAVDLTVIDENPGDHNLDRWVAEADVVCDCPPTFEERFALNRAAVRHRKPMVEAAMCGFEAYLTAFVPGSTPCLQCLFPEAPADWSAAGFPVLGAVSGTIACLAAIEAVKLLTGLGRPLAGQLLTLDTETHEYRKLRIRRVPDCPTCGRLPDDGGGPA